MVGPDDARVAHVDDRGVLQVQSDPEGHEQDERHRHPAHRHAGHERLRTGTRLEAGERHPHQQIREERVHERHRDVDPPLVEVELREAKAEQDGEIEVNEAQWPPRIEEGRHEEERER